MSAYARAVLADHKRKREIARIIEDTAKAALFNGAGEIINPEIFTEAASTILDRVTD